MRIAQNDVAISCGRAISDCMRESAPRTFVIYGSQRKLGLPLTELVLMRRLVCRYAGHMAAASSFELSDSKIDLWSFPTKASRHVVARFERVLVPEERDRAFRFRYDYLYVSFVVGRGVLRYLLGQYLNCDPAKVCLVGLKGKPALAPPSSIRFNATHSGDLGVIAVSLYRDIGVDVEQRRQLPDMQQIAEHFFVRRKPRKLCIKATGDGLSAPLRSFRVTVRPEVAARFVHVQHNVDEARAWTLHDLKLAFGYAAALAYRDQQRSLSLYSVMTALRTL